VLKAIADAQPVLRNAPVFDQLAKLKKSPRTLLTAWSCQPLAMIVRWRS
jgi:hypothetical protein